MEFGSTPRAEMTWMYGDKQFICRGLIHHIPYYATISANNSRLLYSITVHSRLGGVTKWMIDQNFVKPIAAY